MNHYVYILRCADDTLYCGYTTDLKRRLSEHNGERPAGARYTRSRRPVVLVYQEYHADRSSAQRREAELKQLPRAAKIRLTQTKSGANMTE